MAPIVRRLVRLLLALVAIMPVATTALAQDATPVPGPPLVDLAAMALTPDDLAAGGMTGFLVADGRTQTREDRVAQRVASAGEDPAAVRRVLAGLGWTRDYRSRLARPTADLAGAWVRGAFARAHQDSGADMTVERVAGAPSFGDESVVLKFATPGEDGQAIGYAVFARVGNQDVSLTIISFGAPDLDGDVVMGMAAVQVTCFQAGVCAESAPLPAGLSA